MDLGTVIGLILATISIIGSILYGSPLSIFIDVPSVAVVGGGVIATTLIKWSLDDLKALVQIYMKAIFSTPVDPKGMIDEIQKLSETARRESVFALEKVAIADPFLKKAVLFAADNRPPDVIAAILQLEIDSMADRHGKGVEMLEGMGADGPAFGMIGTLIGLVQMLQNMSDPTAIGPAMAVALLTTLYGSVIANVFTIPVASKLKLRSKAELTKMNIVVAGVLGIVAGENPRVIREKLDSFLAPGQRAVPEDKGEK